MCRKMNCNAQTESGERHRAMPPRDVQSHSTEKVLEFQGYPPDEPLAPLFASILCST